MKISRDQADLIAKFSLLLSFLISRLKVNMLVKGSLLIQVLNGLTSPNPIQWIFYTANILCVLRSYAVLQGFGSLFVKDTALSHMHYWQAGR